MKKSAIFATLLVLCLASCTSTSDPDALLSVHYDHPLADAGRTVIYVDGNRYRFYDDFNYAEYYEGNELEEEFPYYLKIGINSLFNIDLNADSNYFQMLVLGSKVELGVYQMTDTPTIGKAFISFDLDDTLENSPTLTLQSGALQITKVDTANKRVSGIFTAKIHTPSGIHTIEGSFTDIFFRNGISGGEVVSAEISGNNWTSEYTSHLYHSGFGNNSGQGVKSRDYFAITSSTQESPYEDYETLSFFMKKPIMPGTYDLEPGAAFYNKYRYDPTTSSYVTSAADTNMIAMPHSVTITEYDPVLRRISGTFDFTITDHSPRSPIAVRNGKFIGLFWW